MSGRDPRSKNRYFNGESLSEYLREYVQALGRCLESMDEAMLEKSYQLIRKALEDRKRVYVAGNGGSAAISDHLCCDFTKGTHFHGKPALRTHSLVSNMALLSAAANDFGYERVFSTQIEMYGERGDVLILISSSGNSPNITQALDAARAKGMATIGFTGFQGGALKERADVCLHVEYENYGLVEDSHQILMHCLSQFFVRLRERGIQ